MTQQLSEKGSENLRLIVQDRNEERQSAKEERIEQTQSENHLKELKMTQANEQINTELQYKAFLEKLSSQDRQEERKLQNNDRHQERRLAIEQDKNGGFLTKLRNWLV